MALILTYVTDTGGKTFSREESTRLIASASPVPVYAMQEARLGHGILGGALLEGRGHGRQAARLALRVLNGEPFVSLPIEQSAWITPSWPASPFRFPAGRPGRRWSTAR
jgi:hypothetical protein